MIDHNAINIQWIEKVSMANRRFSFGRIRYLSHSFKTKIQLIVLL